MNKIQEIAKGLFIIIFTLFIGWCIYCVIFDQEMFKMIFMVVCFIFMGIAIIYCSCVTIFWLCLFLLGGIDIIWKAFDKKEHHDKYK